MSSTPTAADLPPSWVAIGRLGRPHGLKGELTVELRTDDPDGRFRAGAALLRPGARPLTVTRSRWHSGRLLVTVEEATDRTGAEALRDTVVYADAAADEPLADPDEFYDHQLVGLSVVLSDGSVVGSITEVLHPPGADLLVVDRGKADDPDDGNGNEGQEGNEVLVPFVRELVPSVDLAGRTLLLTPPPGLLDGAPPGP